MRLSQRESEGYTQATQHPVKLMARCCLGSGQPDVAGEPGNVAVSTLPSGAFRTGAGRQFGKTAQELQGGESEFTGSAGFWSLRNHICISDWLKWSNVGCHILQ